MPPLLYIQVCRLEKAFANVEDASYIVGAQCFLELQ